MRIFFCLLILFNGLCYAEDQIDSVITSNHKVPKTPCNEVISDKDNFNTWVPGLFRCLQSTEDINEYRVKVSLSLLGYIINKLSNEQRKEILYNVASIRYASIFDYIGRVAADIFHYFPNEPIFIPLAEHAIKNKHYWGMYPLEAQQYIDKLKEKNIVIDKTDKDFQKITDKLLSQLDPAGFYLPYKSADDFIEKRIKKIQSVKTITNETSSALSRDIELVSHTMRKEGLSFKNKWKEETLKTFLALPLKSGDENSDHIKSLILMSFKDESGKADFAQYFTTSKD